MRHGGKREGAGRKKGSLNQRTQEIVAQAAAEGIQPLEVILSAMRSAWSAGEVDKAVKHAVEAAPYMHPKLGSIQHSGDSDNPLEVVNRVELVTPTHVNGTDRTSSEPDPGFYGPS